MKGSEITTRPPLTVHNFPTFDVFLIKFLDIRNFAHRAEFSNKLSSLLWTRVIFLTSAERETFRG